MTIQSELEAQGFTVTAANEQTGEYAFSSIGVQGMIQAGYVMTNDAPPTEQHYDVPIIAPDFIVQTPPINPDPELALTEAIAEMEKGQGAEKSIALVALSLAKYLKSKQAKLK